MLATDSVAIWMSPGCEPSSVLVFPAVFRDTGVFFCVVDPPSLGQRSTTFWGRSHSIMARWHEVFEIVPEKSYVIRPEV